MQESLRPPHMPSTLEEFERLILVDVHVEMYQHLLSYAPYHVMCYISLCPGF